VAATRSRQAASHAPASRRTTWCSRELAAWYREFAEHAEPSTREARLRIAEQLERDEWSFYLPAGQGSYNDRRVYKLDFLERSTDECCRVLIRYLAFDRVKSKDSIADARKDYETASQERTAADNLYPAWKKLVEEGDDLLIELLIEKTQTLCGYGPTPEQATKFLTSLFAVAQQPKTQTKVPQSSAPAQTNPPINATVSDENKGGKTRVLIDGKSQDARDAINGLI
jgi:hypothetical protein